MAVRKLPKSWFFDFTIPGFERQRQAGYRTKVEALIGEKRAREELLSGARRVVFRDGYAEYMAATRMKDRGRDAYEHVWKRIDPELGHLYVEVVDTSALDTFKQALPKHLGPKSINQHLILIRATLRFLWKRGKLRSVPYVPMESVTKGHVDWYTQEERDQLLEGILRLEPQWYLFYYLTTRLGLRTGEVCAIAHRQFRRERPRLVVDQAVQRGTKTRDAKLVTRKNDEAYVLDDGGRPGRPGLARERGIWRQGVSLLQDRAVPALHRQPREALAARAAETRSTLAQPQGGAAFGGQPSGHGRRIREGSASPARPSVRAKHAPVCAPRLRRSASARRGAQAGASTARSGIAEWSRQPGGNERFKRLGGRE
ncbi:MAG TPA: hypothetical protein VJV79_20530 [Polyangiaceae bacterium]|nr:hypothetical protein [Polyangiaceae bacterium]